MTTIDAIRIAPIAPIKATATTVRSLPAQAVLSPLGWLHRVAERRRGRLALLEMTDDQLKDIGLSRADAHLEGSRALWE